MTSDIQADHHIISYGRFLPFFLERDVTILGLNRQNLNCVLMQLIFRDDKNEQPFR